MSVGTGIGLLKWFLERLTWRLIAQLAALAFLSGTSYLGVGVAESTHHVSF